MASATFEDVGVTLGRLVTSELEQQQITQWIDNAELQIRLRLGVLADLDADALAFVVTEAVALKVRNPEGFQSEALDDWNGRRFDDNARGQVFISDAWWALLSPESSSGAFSIRPSFVADDPASMDAWRASL